MSRSSVLWTATAFPSSTSAMEPRTASMDTTRIPSFALLLRGHLLKKQHPFSNRYWHPTGPTIWRSCSAARHGTRSNH
uniref:SFRICE_022038 n=1 Tax=Spodoptera frugiperda TaxID=7108 RepID=A0A2H1V8G3_SPOFR